VCTYISSISSLVSDFIKSIMIHFTSFKVHIATHLIRISYRQDAYQLITRQRAVKMETFVRVRKPVTPAKPRRTREEMEAAAEEKRRLAAERAGSKDLVVEKRMQAQLAREAKEAERKRLAAERAEQRAQAAVEKAAAKKEAAERAAAERAAGGAGSRKRKAGEEGVPRKRAKKGGAEAPGMGFEMESGHPDGEAFPGGGEGMEGTAAVSEAGLKKPNLEYGNGLGDYVYAREAVHFAAGPGLLVGHLLAGLPAAISAAAENAPGVSSGNSADVATPAPPVPAVGAGGVYPVPGGSAVLVASTAGTAPAVVVPVPAVSAAGGTSGPATSQAMPQQQMAPSVVLGKVYQQVPPEDVYDWKLTAEKRENDSVMHVYNCSHPDCKASKRSVTGPEGALKIVVYEVAHNHRCQPLPNQGVTTESTAQTPPLTGPTLQPQGAALLPFHDQQAPAGGQPLRAALLQQVGAPPLYSQQLAQLGTGAYPGRVLPQPIVPRQAPVSKPKQPRKKGGGGGQDLDVLFVEECAKVFGPAGEQGLSREEVKSFLSKWSKFPLDTAEGQVKLQQALECGLFEEVGGGRYRLLELETPPSPAQKAVKTATPALTAPSTHAAAMLNNMAGTPIPLRPLPKNITNDVEAARGSVTLNGVGGEVPSEGVPAEKGSTAQAGGQETTSPMDPLTVEEPAVLALGAPSAQPSFPALSPPISALILSDEERASRDNLPLSEEEEALLRKLTVRKQQARRNMVPAWLRESVTAGAARLAWLQARKDRWQGVSGAEERRAEVAQILQVERRAEAGKAPGGVERGGRAGEVTSGQGAGVSDAAKASNVDINDIPFDFSAVEDLPGDQAWLTSPTTGFLGFAPDQEAAFQEAVRPQEGGQAQAQESAPRARIPQRKGPVESGPVVNQMVNQADSAGKKAPAGETEGALERPPVGQPDAAGEKPPVEKETGGGEGVRTEFDKKVESEQRRLTGVLKKRKWGEVQEEELLRRMNWTPEEEALHKLLECRYVNLFVFPFGIMPTHLDGASIVCSSAFQCSAFWLHVDFAHPPKRCLECLQFCISK
jgi:hypothetical protein